MHLGFNVVYIIAQLLNGQFLTKQDLVTHQHSVDIAVLISLCNERVNFLGILFCIIINPRARHYLYIVFLRNHWYFFLPVSYRVNTNVVHFIRKNFKIRFNLFQSHIGIRT